MISVLSWIPYNFSLRIGFLLILSFLLLVGGSLSPLCAEDDKNGVSPNTISLPTGPGSVEGLGESFQPLLSAGSARYAVKIALPPGPAGHGPFLALQYDSGLGFSAVAPGWDFEPGSIRRSVDKGLPRYVDAANGLDDDGDGQVDEIDEIDIIVGPDGEELVELSDGSYRARIEGGFNRFRRVGDGWQVDLKNGTCLDYGLDPGGGGRIAETGLGTYRWLLEKSTDVSGNVIVYSWTSLPGSDRQKFLEEIRYGPGAAPWTVFYFVRFNYENRPDWRLDCRPGFALKTAHRLSSIDIGIQGHLPAQCAVGDFNDDTVADALIARYRLEYAAISPAQEQLVRVTRYGSDGATRLPPISFTYAACQPNEVISAAAALIGGANLPAVVMDSELVDLIDLNRDALPDMLHTDYTGGQHLVYLNKGPIVDGGQQRIFWSQPALISSPDGLAAFLHLDDQQVNLADMDGDGLSDLVHTSIGDEVSYFINRGNLGWGAKANMSIQATAPPAPFSAQNIKTADLDFNKRNASMLSAVLPAATKPGSIMPMASIPRSR